MLLQKLININTPLCELDNLAYPSRLLILGSAFWNLGPRLKRGDEVGDGVFEVGSAVEVGLPVAVEEAEVVAPAALGEFGGEFWGGARRFGFLRRGRGIGRILGGSLGSP